MTLPHQIPGHKDSRFGAFTGIVYGLPLALACWLLLAWGLIAILKASGVLGEAVAPM